MIGIHAEALGTGPVRSGGWFDEAALARWMIDRQCGASRQALHFAVQAVTSGTQDVIVAVGTENMMRVPMGSNDLLQAQLEVGSGPWTEKIRERDGVAKFGPFRRTGGRRRISST